MVLSLFGARLVQLQGLDPAPIVVTVPPVPGSGTAKHGGRGGHNGQHNGQHNGRHDTARG